MVVNLCGGGIVNLRLTKCEMIQYRVFKKIMTAICYSHVRLRTIKLTMPTEVSTQHSQSAAALSSAFLVGDSQPDRGTSERSSNQAIPGQSDPQPLSRPDRPRAVERRSLLPGCLLERDRTPARPNRLAGSGRRTQWASLSSLRQGISGVGT